MKGEKFTIKSQKLLHISQYLSASYVFSDNNKFDLSFFEFYNVFIHEVIFQIRYNSIRILLMVTKSIQSNRE